MRQFDGCRSRPLRHRCRRDRARSSRSTSATRREPISAAVGPRTRRTSSSRRARSRRPGASIERPAGTELLAFEGEIALVIGTAARRVALDDAWAHVGWVTAANDFGLYDLRANDKGSNVRSKGGDGFTPIGPTLLDARAIDPAALRLRTWVNGAARAGRHDGRAALPARAARRRPLAALHARARRRDPHRHAGRLVASSCRAMSSRSRSTPPRLRTDLRPPRHHRDAGRGAVRSGARLASRRRRRPARRGVGASARRPHGR